MARSTQRSNPDEAARRLTLVELEEALTAVDPSVVLVPSRLLRRVIKQVTGISGMGLRVPHRKTFLVSRSQLLSIVEAHELHLPVGSDAPQTALLLPQPAPEWLSDFTVEQVLSKYWRLLFHVRVHEALEQAVDEGRLTAAGVAQRIARIGSIEFNEIRAVLKQEDLLLPPQSDLTSYIEFAAVYLELQHFAESFLPAYFADLRDLTRIDDLLREDVDAAGIFQATRPVGGPDLPWRGEVAGEGSVRGNGDDTRAARGARLDPLGRHRRPSPYAFRALSRRAAGAAAVGNLVRAAILRTRAARLGTSEEARQSRADAKADLNRLAHRLQRALGFSGEEAEDWSKSLISLLDLSSRGIWTAEARMLYDLQKVCVDHERGIYTLDWWRWFKSWGRAPLKRSLPGQRDVLMSKHLAAAAKRLRAVRLSGRVRSRLETLLQSAKHRTEEQLRARFRPKIEAALDQVQLHPKNVPERVARQKLVDELLDNTSERGFLAMGDLRDGLSRNNLKLPDLASLQQFVSGDQLLQADSLLADTLDGVYRRGEIYLRWPQRLSSLGFGLPMGRFFTRYVALPFGGAFLFIEFMQHLVNMVRKHLLDVEELVLEEWARWLLVGLLGSFVLGLMHHAGFRRVCGDALRSVGRVLHVALVAFPGRLLQLPWVQAIVRSRAYRWGVQYLVKPLLLTALLMAAAKMVYGSWQPTLGESFGLFLITNALFNSRLGRNVDELVTDLVAHAWHRFRIHVIATLLRFINEIFSKILESIERLLYTVDEWLRFRSGEGRLATGAKLVLGILWAFIHYVVRMCVNLLVEPQLNPIKHFPVVTVSHKVIGPILFPILESLLAGPLGLAWARLVAGVTIFLVPGAFGFLVWELKENWRLYAANRPQNLEPILVGHHGETVLQFLRPGFRSGTIPKLYAKLRRANRKAFWTGNWRQSHKFQDGLHRVEEHLRRFVDRELLALLRDSRGWPYHEITTGEIHLGSNRIAIEFYCPELSARSLWLELDETSGVLVAGIAERGWLDQLSPSTRQTLQDALAGFYKIAGVHLVREQLEARLPAGTVSYEILEQGLLVRQRDGRGPVRFYPVSKATTNMADVESAARAPILTMSPAECRALVFAWNPISWQRWIATWQADTANVSIPAPTGQVLSVLPA